MKYKDLIEIILVCQVSSLVESVHLSGLGHCGHYTTYTAFPDMNKEVWTCLKVRCKSYVFLYCVDKMTL